MRLAYVTTCHPLDIKNWSGTTFFMGQALKEIATSFQYVGPLTERHSTLFKAKQCFYKLILNKNYLRDREPSILKGYAAQVAQLLAASSADIIFSPGTVPVSYLACGQPVVFWTDANFAAMVDFYPEFSDLCPETIWYGHQMEKQALERCALAIYSSHWAAESAVKYYHVQPAKVKVVPFGANLALKPDIQDVISFINSRPVNLCRLLFIGVDWERKGGNFALEVARSLNRMGLNTELAVLGCKPDGPLPSFVKVLGFISKTNRKGLNKIYRLLAGSHFLILPTRSECYGIVFCEANAFGVPGLGTYVGGIPTVVRNGLNGYLFSPLASIDDYCSHIVGLFTRYHRYKELAISAFHEYETRLNWTVAGDRIRELLTEIHI